MKLTTKKSFTRNIISLGMALLVMGFAAGCSKQLLPPEIEASNNSGSGMQTGFSNNGSGINEGNVGGGNTGGNTGSPEGSGSAGTGFNIAEQNESGFPGGGAGSTGSTGGGDPMFIQEGNIAEGDPGHAGSGPEFGASGEQDFGSGSGMPGDGYTGKAPRNGMASSDGGSFDNFGTGSASGGPGDLPDGSSTLDHPADTHHPFHTGPTAGLGGSPVGSTGGSMGGMTQQEARLADFTDSTDLSDIHFAYDQYDLTEESKQVLRTNAEWLNSNPAARIEIQGHCDERGTNNYNLGLGERRALSTKKFLTALGVDANRIFTISYGEEKPFCFDSNDACWSENRRAHFMVAR